VDERMSNSLTTNPIVIDTPDAAALLQQRIDVVKIRWVSVSASAADRAIVQHKDGTPAWESAAVGANYIDSDAWEKDNPLALNGLKVPTLANGNLYLYLLNRKVPI
jgi:GTP:adenosylcobinamide-phosphate guanylyltransferase